MLTGDTLKTLHTQVIKTVAKGNQWKCDMCQNSYLSVFVSHMRLLCVMSPMHYFEGIVALSSELKLYKVVQ